MQESGENYLETILILEKECGTVRSVDVAQKLAYAKPSISRAVNLLKENQYLTVGRDGALQLTQKGRAVAEGMYERHRILTMYLTSLGVSPETAQTDACRMEHVISEETFEKIKSRAGELCPSKIERGSKRSGV